MRHRNAPGMMTAKQSLAASEDRYLAAQARANKLEAALRTLVADYDAIPEDAQVPEALNNNDHWQAARAALDTNPQ